METRVETDKDGKFEIAVEKGQRLSVVSVDKGSTTVVAKTDGPMTIVMGYAAQTIDVGANRTFSRHESYFFSYKSIFNIVLIYFAVSHYQPGF